MVDAYETNGFARASDGNDGHEINDFIEDGYQNLDYDNDHHFDTGISKTMNYNTSE